VLTALRIADVAVLEAAELALGPGLTALTGETGAGKSILIEALALVLGGRASDRIIRAGKETAEIEAQFELVATPRLAALLSEMGVPECDGTLILRRSIGRGGARRCHVNGRLVTSAQLRDIGSLLVDLSSQHAQHRLLDRDTQLELLDRFAGCLDLRAQHAALWTKWRQLQAELAEAEKRQRDQAERLDYLRFVDAELKELAVRPGEFAEINQRIQRLRAAESLVKAAAEAAALLGDDSGARDQVARAVRVLLRFAQLDPALAALAERARELDALASDLAHDVIHYGRHVDRNERELEQASSRLDALHRAFRKHGGSEEALLARHKAVAAELDEDAADLRIRGLTTATQHQSAQLQECGAELGQRRRAAINRLECEVTATIRGLGMPAAQLRVELSPLVGDDPGPFGNEQAELMLRANAGEAEGPLAAIASGGELSRVLLALQRACMGVAGEDMATVTCIYDEADAGLSGSVGLTLGRFLADVATRQQVLCISHLPQVAAAADTHVVVQKREIAGRTRSELTVLLDDARTAELGRMLGATEGEGDTALAHARQLLAQQRRRGASVRTPHTTHRLLC